MKDKKQNDALLEIGVEEIPADYLESAILKLKEAAEKLLNEKRIGFKKISTFFTVRRLVLFIQGLDDKQSDLSFEKRGPKYDIVFKDGKLTEIGEKFLKSNNVTEKKIIIKQEKNDKYVFVNIFEKGKSVEKILQEIFPEIIKQISFPKSMKWEKSGFLFARPIRWILALFNDKIINFEIASIRSGRKTKTHKYIFSNKEIIVKDVNNYFKLLKKYKIILEQEQRKKMIQSKINKLLQRKKLKIIKDEELLNRLAASVEWVSVMMGEFDEKYLNLPEKIIITAMREHQRYFAVMTEDNKFTNNFINIKDGDEKNNKSIVKKHSEVLFARLNDAEFFYKEDLKIPLINNLIKLKDAIFIAGLGSMYEKVERTQKNVLKISKILNYASPEILEKIAKLSKCDLVTQLVSEKEFAGLRGFMGGVYLKKQGENEIIYKAVRDHYLPNFVGDEVPETYEGAILSLIDKIDNLCGFFIAGFKPTGSKDPYAVRRQALNIIYLILEKHLNFNLPVFIDNILDEYKLQLNKTYDKQEIIDFFKQREINYFKDKGIDYDIINAIIEVSNLNILNDYKKANVLMEARKKKEFNSIIFAISRINNIIPANYNGGAVNSELFDCCEEKELYDKFNLNREKILNSISNIQFKQVFDLIADFKTDIDRYFEKVLVMTEEENKRVNRLNMLCEIKKVFDNFADFSKIVIDRE